MFKILECLPNTEVQEPNEIVSKTKTERQAVQTLIILLL